MKNEINEIPRRNRLDLNSPAEKLIYEAMVEVEELGADKRLTDAVTLLSQAKNLIADFIEAIDQPSSQSSPLPVSEDFELSEKALKQLRLEIDHILDSGANHIRFIEMIKLFIKLQVIPEYSQFRSETNETMKNDNLIFN
jgi:hypothetical protein